MADQGRGLRPGDDGEHVSFCRMCDASCGILARVGRGAVTKISPDPDNPLSRGHLCVKGAQMHQITHDKNRVLHPLKRIGEPGMFARVSWDEALADIARRWQSSLARHGARSCGSYWGNPAAYSAGYYSHSDRLLRDIGVSRFFNAASLDSNARSTASYISFGSTVRMPFPDLPNCDFLIIVGANPLVSNGSIITSPTMREDLDAIAERGRVVVIDPRRTETASRYEHIAMRPAGDVFMLAAMVRQIARDAAIDDDFLARHVTGWAPLLDAVQPFTPELAEQRCGVAAAQIVDLARDFAAAKRGAFYGRVGIGRAPFSTTATFLVDALNIITGKFGQPGGWVFGDSPFSAGKPPADYIRAATRYGDVAQIYGMTPAALMADEILDSGPDQIRSFAMIAGNPVISAPGGERLEQALDDLEISFSIDLYVNESNRYADYILPATSFLERSDIPILPMTHMPRPFIQFSEAVIPPVGESRGECHILWDLAARLEAVRSNRSVVAAECPDFLAELDETLQAAQWPSFATLRAHPHGMMMNSLTYSDWPAKVTHPDEKLHLWHPMLATEFEAMAQARSVEGALLLFGRRDIRSINSWAHNVDRLVRSQHPLLLIHPEDAKIRGIVDGSWVKIAGPGGAVQVRAQLYPDIVIGSICYPHGWGHRGGWERAVAAGGENINIIVERGFGGADALSGVARLEGIPVYVSASTDEYVPRQSAEAIGAISIEHRDIQALGKV